MKKKKINKKRVLILFLIIAIIIVSIIKLNKKSSKNEDTEIDEQAQTTEQVSNDNQNKERNRSKGKRPSYLHVRKRHFVCTQVQRQRHIVWPAVRHDKRLLHDLEDIDNLPHKQQKNGRRYLRKRNFKQPSPYTGPVNHCCLIKILAYRLKRRQINQ